MSGAHANNPIDKEVATGRLFAPRTQVAASLFAGLILFVSLVLYLAHAPASAAITLHWIALAIGLVYGSKAAFEAAKTQFVDIDVLMVAAAVLAAAINHPAEGALLLFLFVLAGGLEELAMEKTTRSVEALHKLMPTKAERWDSVAGAWTPAAPESLQPGDRVRVRPGEQFPADADLTVGRTSIDQASLTGESQPRTAETGDEVYGGTVNVGDVVECVVKRAAGDSALSRILHLVTQAQKQREPVQQLIDRLSQPYAVAVFAVSIGVFLLWWLALGRDWQAAMYTAIGLLIVVSPCALVLATPTATLAGISRAARGGVLFKGGKAVERLARLGAVAFDKTGTLTIGRPVVRRITVLGEDVHERRMLAIARALEQTSTHPISHAVVEAAKARGVEAVPVEDVRYDPGRGVRAVVDGAEARMGSLAFAQPLLTPDLYERTLQMLGGLQERGLIGNVCVHNNAAAVFVLADASRPGADCLVERLHALGVKPVVMLTGDNKSTGEAIGRQLGLDEVYTEQLPEDKVAHVERLKQRLTRESGRSKHTVGVIGDGVNDAPALAAAGVSIAIGSIGSDAALENADIVLLADDLSAVPWAVGLARRVRRTITINLVFALGAMLVMAVGVIAGSLNGWRMPLWMGVIGHEGGTLLVVAHSLLVLTYRAVPTCPRTSERAGTVEVRVEGRPLAPAASNP
jgi:Cd2+/Zn2+-exporting ATPase